MQQNFDECIVDGCAEEALAQGLCAEHGQEDIAEQEVDHGEERSELDY